MSEVAFLFHPYSLEIMKSNLFYFYPQLRFLRPLLSKFSDYQLKYLYSKMPVHKFLFNLKINVQMKEELNFTGIMVPMFPAEMISNEKKAISMINFGVKIAENLGAKILGLGGFTSIVGNQGELVSKSTKIPITTGNTMTVVLTIEGVLEACKKINKKTADSCLCIIGATGDIGTGCARGLSKYFHKTILCSRKIDLQNNLVKELQGKNQGNIAVSTEINNALKEADVIILATSASNDLVSSDLLKKGSIVCDVALPHNISREIREKRKDIFIFDGGRAKIPFFSQISDLKWKALFPRNAIYGCLAEVFLLGLDKRFVNYSLGRGNISIERIEEMAFLSKKYNFELADFYCNDYLYTKDDFEYLRRQ